MGCTAGTGKSWFGVSSQGLSFVPRNGQIRAADEPRAFDTRCHDATRRLSPRRSSRRMSSMTLFGFEETRISWSLCCSGIAGRTLRRLVGKRTQRASQSLFEAGGSGETREAFLDEHADAAMNRRPLFAVRAELQMFTEIPL